MLTMTPEIAIRSPSDVAAYLSQTLKKDVLFFKKHTSTLPLTLPPQPPLCSAELWTSLWSQGSAYSVITHPKSPSKDILDHYSQIFAEHYTIFEDGLSIILFHGSNKKNQHDKNIIASTLIDITPNGEIQSASFDTLSELNTLL